MSFDDLLRIYGPWVALIIAAVASIWGTAKLALPRLVDAWVEDKKKARDAEVEMLLGERDDDIALFSQVVNLQTRLVKQNETLIEFMTGKLDSDLQKMANEVHQELRDIDKRWLAAAQQIEQHKAQAHILSIEVAKLADSYKSIEDRVASLVAFGLEKGAIDRSKDER